MSRHIDAIEELIDGALYGDTADGMRWIPEQARVEVFGPLVAVDGIPTDVETWRTYLTLASEERIAELVGWARAVCASLVEWVQSVIDALAPVIRKVVNDLRAFSEQTEKGRNLEFERHGSAAVCPRHGPTKGGLCRKC